jgi:hypothetical protein
MACPHQGVAGMTAQTPPRQGEGDMTALMPPRLDGQEVGQRQGSRGGVKMTMHHHPGVTLLGEGSDWAVVTGLLCLP